LTIVSATPQREIPREKKNEDIEKPHDPPTPDIRYRPPGIDPEPEPGGDVKTLGQDPVEETKKSDPAGLGRDLPLPHERDQSTPNTNPQPDPVILQAKRDLDAGLVDTDMRATPGLDAKKRRELVPGPGGKSPSETFKKIS
jgi:hypothetical protein